MYKIAICDDTEFERIKLEKYIKDYLKNNNIRGDVVVFDHPDTLLNANEAFDLYLLDIMMPMCNGIELGKILTEQSDTTIVYFTSSEDFAIEAFKVKACHYVVKPYNKSDFYIAMDRAFEIIKKDRYVTFKTGKDIVKVDISHITYCETQKNYQEIYFFTDREVLTVRMTAKELYKKFEPFNIFIQGGSRYIINYMFIDRIVKNCVVLIGEKELYISERALKDFKNNYTLLLSKEVT